jgi:hypothetical protein
MQSKESKVQIEPLIQVVQFIIMEPETGFTIPLFNPAKPGIRGSRIELEDPRLIPPRIFPTKQSGEKFITQWKRGVLSGTDKQGEINNDRTPLKLLVLPVEITLPMPKFNQATALEIATHTARRFASAGKVKKTLGPRKQILSPKNGKGYGETRG